MRFEINKGVIRRARLWLARRLTPADCHLHDPGEICPCIQNLLHAVCLHQLKEDYGAGQLKRFWMDVTEDVDEAIFLDLLTRTDDGGVILTKPGEQALAKLWGPDYMPPWAWGHFSCDDHGDYELHPGERADCPGCLTRKAVTNAITGGAPRTPRWRSIWPSGRAPR